MAKEKLYRPNVAMIIVSNKYPKVKEVFIAQRNDLIEVWQFPQGGIDEGESAKEALFREMEEEIGTSEAKIIAKYPGWLKYDFPPHIAKSMKPYSGQKQKYFLVKLKKSAVIDINTKHPEFSDYKFVSVDEVLKLSASFKKDVYEKVINYFKKEGFL
jgi:putative (di)nucleoside polyphosphate hydrolase